MQNHIEGLPSALRLGSEAQCSDIRGCAQAGELNDVSRSGLGSSALLVIIVRWLEVCSPSAGQPNSLGVVLVNFLRYMCVGLVLPTSGDSLSVSSPITGLNLCSNSFKPAAIIARARYTLTLMMRAACSNDQAPRWDDYWQSLFIAGLQKVRSINPINIALAREQALVIAANYGEQQRLRQQSSWLPQTCAPQPGQPGFIWQEHGQQSWVQVQRGPEEPPWEVRTTLTVSH